MLRLRHAASSADTFKELSFLAPDVGAGNLLLSVYIETADPPPFGRGMTVCLQYVCGR